MAAAPTPHAASTLTPPSSSHGTPTSWNFSVPKHSQNFSHPGKSRQDHNKNSSENTNTGSYMSSMLSHSTSRPELSQKRMDTFDSTRSSKSNQSVDGAYLTPARITALNRKDSSISDTGSAPDSLLDLYGQNRSGVNSMDLSEARNGVSYGQDDDPERSRWIHRDKLAQIESQELQAAGIFLPRARPASKSGRRDRSRDHSTNGNSRSEQQKRQKMESIPTEENDENEVESWDFRSPEEIAAEKDGRFGSWSSQKGFSRLPLSKNSPLPIPLDYIARDTPVPRKQSNGWTADDDLLAYPKTRGRSDSEQVVDDNAVTPTPAKKAISESSPTKKGTTSAGRKPSATPGSRSTSAQARPKTRSGPNSKEVQRPPTRSGELGPSSSVKKPEGDPPWLSTMYKPDPRLPPDQQLLPTVAKRLQQEQWAKDGKFGDAYDTEFRPMNENQFHERPEPDIVTQTIDVPTEKRPDADSWPLRSPKSPTLSLSRPGTAGGYSTMPKIHDTPTSALPSPLPTPLPQRQSQIVRMQELSEEPKAKKGCGCCVVM